MSKDEAEFQKAFRMTPTAPLGRRQSVRETHTSGSNSKGGMAGLDSEDKRAASLRGTWDNQVHLNLSMKKTETEMAQKLEVALSEDPGLTSSTHTATHNCL